MILSNKHDWPFLTNKKNCLPKFPTNKHVINTLFIMLTCPCNVDPLTHHFYIVKLGFTGVYIFSIFLL